MAEIKIKKGDVIFCVHRIALGGGTTPGLPIKGTILGITAKLNRQIAVELDEPIEGGHNCDGRGKDKHCVWCRPNHILTPAEWDVKLAAMKAASKATKDLDTEVGELVLRNTGK